MSSSSTLKFGKPLTASALALGVLAGGVTVGTTQSTQNAPVVHSAAATQGAPSVHEQGNQGEQIGAIAKQIVKWAKDKGGSIWSGLTNAVSKGVDAVVNWMTSSLPGFLKDVAMNLGITLVAEYIINNWPF